MSRRLGGALADLIRRMEGRSKFVLVEGVPVELAEGMAASWDETMPKLAIASAAPSRFGQNALEGSATGLRNRFPGGIVLVLCEGEQVPDRSGLNLFANVAPGDLLDTPEGLALLAQQQPPAPLDGPARAVREAISRADAATRPSAVAVATYFDRLACGEDPLASLPLLGAFEDTAVGGRIDGERIGDNLSLASRRTSEETLRRSAVAEIRLRAERVLGRRPGLRNDPVALDQAADEVMTLLHRGDPALLSRLRYDEAREILEQRSKDFASDVLAELDAYKRAQTPNSREADLPWDTYEAHATNLRRGALQRAAAKELLDLDSAQSGRVFAAPTRTKLERLLRDKAINGSNPSCPEAALVRAIHQLGSQLRRVQLIGPLPQGENAQANRSNAVRILTLACARLRLGALMRRLQQAGTEVDGLLLNPADEHASMDTYDDADLGVGDLVPLQLRLHGTDGATVQVDWKPDLDDAALLRAALLFAEQPALTLTLATEPTLSAFCGDETATAVRVPTHLTSLAQHLTTLARSSLDTGLSPLQLQRWADAWTTACQAQQDAGNRGGAEALALAGAVTGGDHAVALTGFAPLKSEWLGQYLDALWTLIERSGEAREDEPVVATALGVARTTASHHPAHVRITHWDRVLLPTSEGRVWSLFGGQASDDESGYAGEALLAVITRLLMLQPEAAGHLRCLAYGPGAADLLTAQALGLFDRIVGRTSVTRVEIFCVGEGPRDRPTWRTLAKADDLRREGRDVLELRYLNTLEDARAALGSLGRSGPSVHLALVTGITEHGNRLQIESPEVALPPVHDEVLFAPRTSMRANRDRRMLLMPPATSASGLMWLQLMNAVEDEWIPADDHVRVPEVRTTAMDIADQLRQVHDIALWVATLDRYATRDSLEQALGADRIAILHQERRLGGDSPLSLVLSQKSGGPADRAIGRSLKAAGIVSDRDLAIDIGTKIRKVASQGYGILALEAATTGAGINELVGHVVAFSLLATKTTPWPLPPGCRVLLVSLDEYRHWFPGKRADLLAIALDPAERGVHVATIEVKARRSDEIDAASGALDQLNQTLAATRWAAYPEKNSVYSRLWLNRIAEAAYSVARESRFRLDGQELAALESFRLGAGTLEWAGVGLVFGPNVDEINRHYPQKVAGDIVPVVLHSIKLTQTLLDTATSVELTSLRTVKADSPPLRGGRTRRRPESGVLPRQRDDAAPPQTKADAGSADELEGAQSAAPIAASLSPARSQEAVEPVRNLDAATRTDRADTSLPRPSSEPPEFHAPILGWDAVTGDEVRWHPAGPSQNLLRNGHMLIWGSSGMGKTQFTMSMLAQLAQHSGSRFGIADFKNDYSTDTGFPLLASAEFVDLWNEGAPYNPLALAEDTDRAVSRAVIEIRDTVEEAARSFTRLGHRQRAKLDKALQEAYSIARSEGRWPTLRLLDDMLDNDLSGVMGDLTRNELFKTGKPLGEVINKNVVFGLSEIPGNGQTTVLAAGFILSALLLKIQSLPPIPNSIRYVVVVDEAHRVAAFKAIDTMIREGRSKGLAVLLATQQPGDLPEVVSTNAQTKICFRLPDATVATVAARKLNPGDPGLAEQIRTLGEGEALVSLGGAPPRLLNMAQVYRHRDRLGLPSEDVAMATDSTHGS